MKKIEAGKAIIATAIILVIVGACTEFFEVAQGTGTWWNGLAFTWAVLFAIFCFVCLCVMAGGLWLVLSNQAQSTLRAWRNKLNERVGPIRWLFILAVSALPVFIFQLSVWGIVFQGLFIRLLGWGLCVLFLTSLLSEQADTFEWRRLLAVMIFTAGIFAGAAAFGTVTAYPFALGWSEGNRLWDFSIMFGRERYNFPPDQPIDVLLDPGRQFIGGLPFLFSGNNILTQRLWGGLTTILPSLFLGLAIYRTERLKPPLYVILVLWTFLFLNQASIHPPLILSAVLIALAWRRPLWIALLLTILGAWVAGLSRYTWMFAPAAWICILELSTLGDKIDRKGWVRLIWLTGAALVGGVLLPDLLTALSNQSLVIPDLIANADVLPGNLQQKISQQPLLWYRLFPNATFGLGIVLALMIAVAPLLLLASHLYRTQVWRISRLQKLVFSIILAAFLGVGLIVSVKIGGGGDLHNLDMFFLTLVFIMGLIWQAGGKDWLMNSSAKSLGTKLLLGLFILIPCLTPLKQMRSYGFYELTPWLTTLTDTNNARALDLIPSESVVAEALTNIRAHIRPTQATGDILFIDQRQLLTFGYVEAVPLVPEYDKKVLIEQSFRQNRSYFEQFYSDLENRRFSLIVIQPLTTELQGSQAQFSEENNLWVQWVAKPLLCFYDVELTLWEVNVQLLTPRREAVDCSQTLP